MFVALASLLTGRPVRSDVAMTGEISLRGLVLPIGGVKEKVLAALRAGITTVMLPARNRRDLEEIPADAREKLKFVWIEQRGRRAGGSVVLKRAVLFHVPQLHRSTTRSRTGREQQTRRLPSAGMSRGSGPYTTAPETRPVSQLWQTPLRHDQRTGTSQASASSRMLW